MLAYTFRAGVQSVRRRPGLVFLIYGVNLALAFLIAVPVYSALQGVVGPSGFSGDLARGFDLVLWADIVDEIRVVFGALGAQLFWAVPLYLAWQVASGVGLMHALRGDGASFWQGVGRFTGRGLLVALGFAALAAGLLVMLGIVAAVTDLAWPGEVGSFWRNMVVLPVLAVAGFALLDLLHDVARMALVFGARRARRAIAVGFGWPFRQPAVFALYAGWFVVAAAVLVMPVVLDTAATAGTTGGVWLLFLGQQLLLGLRAAVTVGWVGSEVALFEALHDSEALWDTRDEVPEAPEPHGVLAEDVPDRPYPA